MKLLKSFKNCNYLGTESLVSQWEFLHKVSQPGFKKKRCMSLRKFHINIEFLKEVNLISYLFDIFGLVNLQNLMFSSGNNKKYYK